MSTTVDDIRVNTNLGTVRVIFPDQVSLLTADAVGGGIVDVLGAPLAADVEPKK